MFSAHFVVLLSLIAASHSLDTTTTTTSPTAPNAKTTATGTGTATTTGTTLPAVVTKTDTTPVTADPHFVPIKTPDTTIEPTLVTVTNLEKLTTADANTYVWITVTQNGLPVAISTAYVQQFTPMYETIQTWSSGEVGLGSLKGQVGTTRTYQVVPYIYH